MKINATFIISDELDDDGEIEIELKINPIKFVHYLTKNKAIEVINHLIRVFQIDQSELENNRDFDKSLCKT